MKHNLALMLFAAIFCRAQQQTDSIQTKIYENYLLRNNWLGAAYKNPAQQFLRKEISLSSLSTSLQKTEKERYEAQSGSGGSLFSVETQSYLKLSSANTVWGEAHYQNGEQKAIIWNETADAHLLYPYLSADAVGGSLQNEAYSISGGFNRAKGKTQFGLETSYRASNQYRKIDPRPNNITSDFSIKGGLARDIARYSIGADAFYRRYTQNNEIKFYNKIGNTAIYHLTGLGTFNNLLVGNKLESYYDGQGYGASLSLLPKNRQGLMLHLGYKNFSFDKVMPSFADLTASSIDENHLHGEASWLWERKNSNFKLNLEASIIDRAGTEGIFDNRSTNNYITIGRLKSYLHQQQKFSLSTDIEYRTPSSAWYFMPFVALHFSKESYKKPMIYQDFESLYFGLRSRYTTMLNGGLLSISYNLNNRYGLDARSHFGYQYPVQALENAVKHKFNLRSQNYWETETSIKYHLKPIKKQHIFAQINFWQQYFPKATNTGYLLGLGIEF